MSSSLVSHPVTCLMAQGEKKNSMDALSTHKTQKMTSLKSLTISKIMKSLVITFIIIATAKYIRK